MTDPNSNNVRQRDLRAACIHEHAHAAVAMHFLVPGRVVIFENPGGSSEFKHFGGRFHRYGIGQPPPHELRMIGLAGTVAEELDRTPHVQGWEIIDWLDAEIIELSATDAQLAGDFTEVDIEECLRLVRELWPQIDEAAKLAAAGFSAA